MALDVFYDLEDVEFVVLEESVNAQFVLVREQRYQRHHRGKQHNTFYFVLAGDLRSRIASQTKPH